jgi:hypothetical protein
MMEDEPVASMEHVSSLWECMTQMATGPIMRNARKVDGKSSKEMEVGFDYLDYSRWLTHTLVLFQAQIH